VKNIKVLLAGAMIFVGLVLAAYADFGTDAARNPNYIGSVILVLIAIAIYVAIQKRNRNRKKTPEGMAEEETRLKTPPVLPMLICCPVCNKEISRAATACPSCGHPINPQAIETSQRSWNPGVAAVLSLVIPGAGQMYKDHIGAGILWFIFIVGGYSLFIIPGLVLHLLCIFNAAHGRK